MERKPQTFWRLGGTQGDCRWCTHPAVADWDGVGACGTHLYELLALSVDALVVAAVEERPAATVAEVA